MPASLTTVANITKEIYGPRIVDQLENETTLLKRIEKTSDGTTSEAGGKYVTFPLKTRRNTGIGYRNEMEALPAAGQQGWQNIRVQLKYGYGRVQLSGQAMDLVSENYQAFAKAITEEMEGLKNDILKDTNRVLWGNGVGTLATVDTAAGPVATISLGTGADDLKYIDMDMAFDVYDSTGVTLRGANRIVSAMNLATGDITFTGGNLTVSIGDILVRTGNINREPNGLSSLVTNSGTLFNLSAATEPTWASVVDAAVGALSEARMIKMCDNLRTNGGRPSVIFTDLGSRRAYFNLLTTQRRFTDTKDYEGGFKGLSFQYDDDIPVVTDVDAPAGKMWFLRESDYKVYRRKPWYWEDTDGNVWKWITGFDAWEALMKQYWEFAVERRNTQGVMTGITAG